VCVFSGSVAEAAGDEALGLEEVIDTPSVYLHQLFYVIYYVCLPVCLSVCLFVTKYCHFPVQNGTRSLMAVVCCCSPVVVGSQLDIFDDICSRLVDLYDEDDMDLLPRDKEPEAWSVTVDIKTLKSMSSKDIKRQDHIWGKHMLT